MSRRGQIWLTAAVAIGALAAPLAAQVQSPAADAPAEPAVTPVDQAQATPPATPAPPAEPAATPAPAVEPAAAPAPAVEPAAAPAPAVEPAATSAPPPSVELTVAPAPAPSSAVESYYASHPGAQLWLGTPDTRAAAAKLPEILRRAPFDGLANGPALATAVEGATARSQPEDDKIISDAWVRYVKAIKAPVSGVSYGDPELALVAPTTDAILAAVAQAPSLSTLVDQVSSVNPLYAALRDEAAKAGGVPDPRVRATLDRLRLIPAKGRAIMVDIPSATLMMIEDGKVVDSMKVIVGKKTGATPVLASTIHYVTFNPVWHIPQDIARVRVAPVVIQRGVGYLTLARYQTVGGFGGEKEIPIDPATIDWKGVREGTSEVYVRQLSGPQNMMGKVKFGFVNDYGVFLHDTPHKELFARDKRFLSHGCIRLERPEALASWLLGSSAAAPSGEPEQLVPVEKGVPIYVSYLTAQPAADGAIAYAEDIYGLDTAGAAKAVMASAATAQ
jgi:murein L,D-transpeptidase YcbB/YkuD